MIQNLNSILIDSTISSFELVLRPLWPIWTAFLFLLTIKFYRLYKLKKSGMYEVDKMTGSEFEIFLGRLFQRFGYEVKQVGSSVGDYGADLVVAKNNISTAIQAKRYNSLIGINAVREVLGSIKYYNCSNGIVITNSYFTNQAKLLAKANNIELWDRNGLSKRLLQTKDLE